MDNRFVERLWRSLKYEAVHLEEIVVGHHARRLIGSWFDHYNHRRRAEDAARLGRKGEPDRARRASPVSSTTAQTMREAPAAATRSGRLTKGRSATKIPSREGIKPSRELSWLGAQTV